MTEKNIDIEDKLDELILKTKDKELIITYREFKSEIHEQLKIIDNKLDNLINNN